MFSKSSFHQGYIMRTSSARFRALFVLGFVICNVVTAGEKEGPGLRAGWKPGVAGEAGDIKTTMFYLDEKREVVAQMIVLANDKGAAAVRVTTADPMDGITLAKYEYRYESFDGKIQHRGVGELFEQRDKSGVMGGNVHLKIADLFVGWSPADHDCCWIYYTPEKVSVYLVGASLFTDRFEPIPFQPGEFSKTPALDLKRFKR